MARFEWDETKRETNIRKHGIDFADVPPAFDGPNAVFPDERFDYDEARFILTGYLDGRPVVIAFTCPEESVIRILSARRATRKDERKVFAN